MLGPYGTALLSALLLLGPASAGDCIDMNYCNGHGNCDPHLDRCDCYEGWGAATDVAVYKFHDCSGRTCPAGPAWADVATDGATAHRPAECSGKGKCDKLTGTCKCSAGFSGDACQRFGCLYDCSGHGQCVSIKKMATMPNALPLSKATTYTGLETTTRWDQDRLYGCVCDSSWPVGLGAGERQEPEWFGPWCNMRHCPSGDDPYTTHVDETNCTAVAAAGGHGVGELGNLCQVDCANRGKCDTETGECGCWTGSYGHDCTLLSALAR